MFTQSNRYLRPPWVACELESRELLAVCLKKITGLQKVKLVDATFVWTEPHSRRIKVKLTIQKEVFEQQQSYTSRLLTFCWSAGAHKCEASAILYRGIRCSKSTVYRLSTLFHRTHVEGFRASSSKGTHSTKAVCGRLPDCSAFR